MLLADETAEILIAEWMNNANYNQSYTNYNNVIDMIKGACMTFGFSNKTWDVSPLQNDRPKLCCAYLEDPGKISESLQNNCIQKLILRVLPMDEVVVVWFGIIMLERGNWFYWAKLYLLSHISDILTANSWITEPISSMFVLISMYFSWWFQIRFF